MKTAIKLLPLVVGGIALLVSSVTMANQSADVEGNEAAVDQAFQAWADGTGSPFSLLSEEMQWTIIGSTRTAGTYNLEAFGALVEPFNARIAQPLKPTEWQTFARGDQVVIHFLAKTPLKTGELYENEYAWFFRFEEGEVIDVRAFLDLPKFERALYGKPL